MVNQAIGGGHGGPGYPSEGGSQGDYGSQVGYGPQGGLRLRRLRFARRHRFAAIERLLRRAVRRVRRPGRELWQSGSLWPGRLVEPGWIRRRLRLQQPGWVRRPERCGSTVGSREPRARESRRRGRQPSVLRHARLRRLDLHHVGSLAQPEAAPARQAPPSRAGRRALPGRARPPAPRAAESEERASSRTAAVRVRRDALPFDQDGERLVFRAAACRPPHHDARLITSKEARASQPACHCGDTAAIALASGVLSRRRHTRFYACIVKTDDRLENADAEGTLARPMAGVLTFVGPRDARESTVVLVRRKGGRPDVSRLDSASLASHRGTHRADGRNGWMTVPDVSLDPKTAAKLQLWIGDDSCVPALSLG